MREKQLDSVAVNGGDYRVARWPGGGAPLLAVHGITASHMAWTRVVNHFGVEHDIYAPDLRGRGANATLPAPYGFPSHIDDLLAVLDHYQLESVYYVGHSLGAYIGLDLAHAAPSRIRGIILVDGGLALPQRQDKDPEETVKAIVGPALARLEMTFPDRESYHQFWREHPAFQDPEAWNDDVAAYADYDLVGAPPAMRSCVNADAVMRDAYGPTDLAMVTRVDELTIPTLLLTATRGLLNQPDPLLPLAMVTEKAERNDHLMWEEIDDTNHYSITMGAGAARVAASIDRFIAEH